MGEVLERQTMQERQRDMLAAIARCARSWQGGARLLGNLRADEIGDACEWAIAEVARLQREVVNRNQRALDGDRATRNEATLLDHIQAAEAERDRYRAEVAQLREERDRYRATLAHIAAMPEYDQDDAHRLRDHARRALTPTGGDRDAEP